MIYFYFDSCGGQNYWNCKPSKNFKNKQKLKAEQLFSSFSKIVFAGMYTHTLCAHLWSFLWHYQVSECNNVHDSWPLNQSKKMLNTSLDLFFWKIAGWTRRVDIIRNTFSKKQFFRNTTYLYFQNLNIIGDKKNHRRCSIKSKSYWTFILLKVHFGNFKDSRVISTKQI